MHDVLVVDPLSHFCQQPVVPDMVKVGAQIKIKNPRLPLDDGFSHSLDRVMCLPFGPISKRSRLEIRLEHRLEDELERALHHSVADRRHSAGELHSSPTSLWDRVRLLTRFTRYAANSLPF